MQKSPFQCCLQETEAETTDSILQEDKENNDSGLLSNIREGSPASYRGFNLYSSLKKQNTRSTFVNYFLLLPYSTLINRDIAQCGMQ